MYKLFIASLLVATVINAAEIKHITKQELQNAFHTDEENNRYFTYTTNGLCLSTKDGCRCIGEIKQFLKECQPTHITVSFPWHKLREFTQILPSAGNYKGLIIINYGTSPCWYAAPDIYLQANKSSRRKSYA